MESMNSPQQYSQSYLDQIAPQGPKRSFMPSSKMLYVLIGVALIVVVLVLVAIVNQINASKVTPWERLSARLTTTTELVDSSSGKIKNSQLRSTSSNAKISLTNTERDIAAPLLKLNIDTKKIKPSIVTSESGTAALARLEDARLNAKYDSTYAREMSFQLANLLTLLQQIYSSSKNPANKEFLKATYDNFAPIQKSLAEFSASNE